MPDCDYCEASFDDEDAYLSHLESEHEGELGPIDRRRIGGGDDDGGLSTGPIALGLVLVVAAAIVGYTVFVAGGSGGGGSGNIGPAGSAHYHGTINMTVTGDRVDFSRQEYQLQADRFHFEGGDGERWHAHATGVTLGFAMETLGIEVTDDSVTFEGTTYTDGEGYEVIVEVNGNDVGPGYVLKEGDHIRIVVRET